MYYVITIDSVYIEICIHSWSFNINTNILSVTKYFTFFSFALKISIPSKRILINSTLKFKSMHGFIEVYLIKFGDFIVVEVRKSP